MEGIVSAPDFEIITTFAYSTGLPHHPASLPVSHCYLLQYGVDRLYAAAEDFGWTTVVEDLSKGDRIQSLASQINAHMASSHGETCGNPDKKFIVRLAFRKDGGIHIQSGPRPVNLVVPYYPLVLSTTPPLGAEHLLIPVYLDRSPTTPSLLTKHKTTYRQPYSSAWTRVGLDETVSPATSDVLLQNQNGQIMGAVFRSVYLWRNGKFVTPSSETGCKTGVSRRWAIEHAGIEEGIILASDIKEGEVIWLSSAVGGFTQGVMTLEGRK